jgi:sec-independent protein translocase protein TatA
MYRGVDRRFCGCDCGVSKGTLTPCEGCAFPEYGNNFPVRGPIGASPPTRKRWFLLYISGQTRIGSSNPDVEGLDTVDEFQRKPHKAGSDDGRESMLNNIGLPGILLIAVVVLVLFGRGKISSLMGEVGKGITSFKKGVADGNKEIEDAANADAADVAKDVTPEQEKDKA